MTHAISATGLDALFRRAPWRSSGRRMIRPGFRPPGPLSDRGRRQRPIYPVNPNRDTVPGLKAYKSLADVPETPDVALLAVSAGLTEQAVRECVAQGVGRL